VKDVIKWIADVLALVAALPFVLCYKLSGFAFGSLAAFSGWTQFYSLFPGTIGAYLRRGFFRCVLPSCGRDVCISFGTVFSHPTARLGNRVYIGIGCMIGDATVEDDALVGSHVSIINGRRQHGIERLDIPIREQPGEYPRVTIGRDAWIGDRAIVTENIGRHAIVGAGAVVTKPVPDCAIVVGNPARIVSMRSEQVVPSADPLAIGDRVRV
jgi:acetyltransferase-like isoleucine patch superfamily enzyme